MGGEACSPTAPLARGAGNPFLLVPDCPGDIRVTGSHLESLQYPRIFSVSRGQGKER